MGVYVVVARLSVLSALRLVGARLAVRIVVPGTGCRVQRKHHCVQGSGFRVQGSGCSGLRVEGEGEG